MTELAVSLLRVGGVLGIASAAGWLAAGALVPSGRVFRLERLAWGVAVGTGLLAAIRAAVASRRAAAGVDRVRDRGRRLRRDWFRVSSFEFRVGATSRSTRNPELETRNFPLASHPLRRLRSTPSGLDRADVVQRLHRDLGAEGEGRLPRGRIPAVAPRMAGVRASGVPAGASASLCRNFLSHRPLGRPRDGLALPAVPGRHARRGGRMAPPPWSPADGDPARDRDPRQLPAALLGLPDRPGRRAARSGSASLRDRARGRPRRERVARIPAARGPGRRDPHGDQERGALPRGRRLRRRPGRWAGSGGGRSPRRLCRPRSSSTSCICCGAGGCRCATSTSGSSRSGVSARPSQRPPDSSVRRGGPAPSWWWRSSFSERGGRTPARSWRSRPRPSRRISCCPSSRFAARSGWSGRRLLRTTAALAPLVAAAVAIRFQTPRRA